LRRWPIGKIEEHFVYETPAPRLRRIVTFDDGMPGAMEVFGGMPPWRLVAATHVSARPAEPQVDPSLMNFETLLAAQGAWRNGLDSTQVGAFSFHSILRRQAASSLTLGASFRVDSHQPRNHGRVLLNGQPVRRSSQKCKGLLHRFEMPSALQVLGQNVPARFEISRQ
jgi:hypothetical protein